MSTEQDPSGWRNVCSRCHRWYWAAWQPSAAVVRRFELDKTTPHKCEVV